MPDAIPFNPVVSPSVGDTMNQILGMQAKKQALQTGQYQQDIAANQAATSDMILGERQRVASYLSNPANKGKSTEDMADDIHSIAPTTGEDYLSRLRDAEVTHTGLEAARNKLSADRQARVGQVVGSFAGSPLSNQDIGSKLDELVDQDPKLAETVYYAKRSLSHIPDPTTAQNPQAAAQAASVRDKLFAQAQYGFTNGTPLNGSTVDTGASVQPIVSSTVTGTQTPSGPSFTKGIAPGYTQGPNGQIIRVGNSGIQVAPTVGGDNSGGGTSAPTQQATGAKLQPIPRPGINAPAGDQQRYTAQMDEGRKHVNDVSAAANDTQNGVGPTRYRNDQIQDILNSSTLSPTGPGAAQMNWIASKLPGESGDAYQKIGHYLAQNSAAIATKMGVPGTNMGAEQAAAAAGNTAQNKGALLEVTKVNDAMNTALDMYNRGLAKVSNNGADPSKVAAYRQAFGQNFDMNALRYDDALRRGDKEEIDKITSSYGPAGSKQRAQGLQALGQKRKILHSLADTGDLP